MKLGAKESRDIMALKTVGYWSLLGGVEVKRIEYGIEDYLVVVVNAFHTTPRECGAYRVAVRYTKDGRPYIKIYNNNLYLDECIRA